MFCKSRVSRAPSANTDSADWCSNSTHGPVTRPSSCRVTFWFNDPTLVIFSIHHFLPGSVTRFRNRAGPVPRKQAAKFNFPLMIGKVGIYGENVYGEREEAEPIRTGSTIF